MKEIKLIDIVKELASMGHEVQYTLRKDGSLRITKIDGAVFTGSKGNARAREIIGAPLSVKRVVQLEKIKTPKGQFGHKKRKPIPDSLKKAIRRAQRIWKKQGKDKGRITTKNVRYVYENYGLEEAIRRLNQHERYTSGLAYVENVDWIIARLKNDNAGLESPVITSLIELLEERRFDIREEWIQHIYEYIYAFEDNKISAEDLKYYIEKIID